jgi:RHS repeat-associated protein
MYNNYGRIENYTIASNDPVHGIYQYRHNDYHYHNHSNTFAADHGHEDNGIYSSPVDYNYGINGTIRHKYVHFGANGQSREEFYLFDAYGNMNAYCDNRETYAYNGYDDAGERTYKMSLNNLTVTNNQYGFAYLELDKISFYPNGYININQNGEYTKHYYAGDQRIASKIGTGFDDDLCDNLYRFNVMPHELDNARYFAEDKAQYALTFLTIPETWVDIDYRGYNVCVLQGNGTYNYEDELFFYHGDHLSSTQMITDLYGNVVQQVYYAPFGEVITEYNAYWHQGRVPDYKFNAKELDEENGMYYYSARYYNPPTFISRDPLFEKYPTISPYAYCLNNPLIFIDPTGEDVEIVCPVTNKTIQYTPGMAIPEGTSDFVSNAINALNTINTTKEGGAAIGELHTSSNLFSIQQGDESSFRASNERNAYAKQNQENPALALSYQAMQEAGIDINSGSGGTIAWYSSGVSLPTINGQQTNGTIDLAHELFHGLDANRGMLDNRKEQGVPRSEWQAVYRENSLRGQLNLPLRTHYATYKNNVGYNIGTGPSMLNSSGNSILPYWY